MTRTFKYSFLLIICIILIKSSLSTSQPKCEPKGCNYNPAQDITKFIDCEQDGSLSIIIFPGNNQCDEWLNAIPQPQSDANHPCCAQQTVETDENQQALIVGGTKVDIDRYPFMAAVIEYGQFQCGATILRKQYPALILTAAHCHPAFDSEHTIVRLHADYIDDPNAIDSKITHYEIHPNYNESLGEKFDYDIAILWLETDISHYDQLETVTISPIASDTLECCSHGDDLEVIGYGYDLDGTLTPTLEKIDLDYIARFVCRFAYSDEDITNNMVCASSPDKSACNGDSGGPLIIKDTKQQIGIVSWLVSDCQDFRPNVFTDVGVFKPWIDMYLNTITTSTEQPCIALE